MVRPMSVSNAVIAAGMITLRDDRTSRPLICAAIQDSKRSDTATWNKNPIAVDATEADAKARRTRCMSVCKGHSIERTGQRLLQQSATCYATPVLVTDWLILQNGCPSDKRHPSILTATPSSRFPP